LQADLHAGCREQMRGALQAAELESRLVPLRSLDQMVVAPALLTSLRSIVALEKARALLHAAGWGMDEQRGQQRGGTTALFWGPPGSGKRAAAEALAFELGRPMKVAPLELSLILSPTPRLMKVGPLIPTPTLTLPRWCTSLSSRRSAVAPEEGAAPRATTGSPPSSARWARK